MKPVLLLCCICLTACSPKYEFVDRSEFATRSIEHVLLVIDYIEFVDDVGKLMDYDLQKNRRYLQTLEQRTKDLLLDKGYKEVTTVLLSSGLDFDPDHSMQLYHKKQFQDQLVNAPFIYEAGPMSEVDLTQAAIWFNALQRYGFEPVKKKFPDDLARRRVGQKIAQRNRLTPFMGVPPNTAVMYVRVVSPRVSFAKAMGMSLLTGALSYQIGSGSTYVYAVPYGQPYSNAFFIDNTTSALLWKTHALGNFAYFSEPTFRNKFKLLPGPGELEISPEQTVAPE